MGEHCIKPGASTSSSPLINVASAVSGRALLQARGEHFLEPPDQ